MTTAQLTLNKIGNFVGLRFREILNLISTKADRAQVDALPRFHEAANNSDMLNLTEARVGDFCLRGDSKTMYRLRALPISSSSSWEVAVGGTVGTATKTIVFAEAMDPIIQHDMNGIPATVQIYDDTGRPQHADWEPVDLNRIILHFTEALAGRASLTFSS